MGRRNSRVPTICSHNRLVFVEGGKDDVLFLEQICANLGNYLRDQDRFETFDALFLDFIRESVLAGDQGSDLSDAWRTACQGSCPSPRWLTGRKSPASKKKGTITLTRRLNRTDGLLGRAGFGADPNSLRGALNGLEKRLRHLQILLDSAGPRIEAARVRADFLTGQYQNHLGDYLNEPENARRLFDASAPGEQTGNSAETRALACLRTESHSAARNNATLYSTSWPAINCATSVTITALPYTCSS